MSPVDTKSYNSGVAAVVALATDAATRLEGSNLSILRRELAVEALRALASEARALLKVEGPAVG